MFYIITFFLIQFYCHWFILLDDFSLVSIPIHCLIFKEKLNSHSCQNIICIDEHIIKLMPRSDGQDYWLLSRITSIKDSSVFHAPLWQDKLHKPRTSQRGLSLFNRWSSLIGITEFPRKSAIRSRNIYKPRSFDLQLLTLNTRPTAHSICAINIIIKKWLFIPCNDSIDLIIDFLIDVF